jgi:hypothetical protein
MDVPTLPRRLPPLPLTAALPVAPAALTADGSLARALPPAGSVAAAAVDDSAPAALSPGAEPAIQPFEHGPAQRSTPPEQAAQALPLRSGTAPAAVSPPRQDT